MLGGYQPQLMGHLGLQAGRGGPATVTPGVFPDIAKRPLQSWGPHCPQVGTLGLGLPGSEVGNTDPTLGGGAPRGLCLPQDE